MSHLASTDVNLTTDNQVIKTGNTVNFFKLYPSDGDNVNWRLQIFELPLNGEPGKYVDIDPDTDKPFIANFDADIRQPRLQNISQKSRNLLLAQQEAIFVVDIENDDNKLYDWRFWNEGVTCSNTSDDTGYTFSTRLCNSGKTLVITLTNVLETLESQPIKEDFLIDFRFSAVKFSAKAGGPLDKIYYSQDPALGGRRHKHV